jgi:hypothetical protein
MRSRAGLARARRQGTRLGRRPVRLAAAKLAVVAHLPVRLAAQELGVSVNTYRKARGPCINKRLRRTSKNLSESRRRDVARGSSRIGRLLIPGRRFMLAYPFND